MRTYGQLSTAVIVMKLNGIKVMPMSAFWTPISRGSDMVEEHYVLVHAENISVAQPTAQHSQEPQFKTPRSNGLTGVASMAISCVLDAQTVVHNSWRTTACSAVKQTQR
jgi:hypothetical protein